MKTIANLLAVKLAKAGVKAAIEVVGCGEGGGINARVGSVADVFAAEPVAAELQATYGVTILVCF